MWRLADSKIGSSQAGEAVRIADYTAVADDGTGRGGGGDGPDRGCKQDAVRAATP